MQEPLRARDGVCHGPFGPHMAGEIPGGGTATFSVTAVNDPSTTTLVVDVHGKDGGALPGGVTASTAKFDGKSGTQPITVTVDAAQDVCNNTFMGCAQTLVFRPSGDPAFGSQTATATLNITRKLTFNAT